MAKTKTITLDNYKQFKPSELVHSFVSDLDVALKSGKPMDMYSFDDVYANSGCLPCLGGMAIRNLGVKYYATADPISTGIAELGEHIRVSNWVGAKIELKRLYPEYEQQLHNVYYAKLPIEEFNGTIYTYRIKALQKHVLKFVEVLEKAGC